MTKKMNFFKKYLFAFIAFLVAPLITEAATESCTVQNAPVVCNYKSDDNYYLTISACYDENEEPTNVFFSSIHGFAHFKYDSLSNNSINQFGYISADVDYSVGVDSANERLYIDPDLVASIIASVRDYYNSQLYTDSSTSDYCPAHVSTDKDMSQFCVAKHSTFCEQINEDNGWDGLFGKKNSLTYNVYNELIENAYEGSSVKKKLSIANNNIEVSESLFKEIQAQETDCSGLLGVVETEGSPAYYVDQAFKIIRYIAIILLVVLTMYDLLKAIIGKDEDFLQKVTGYTIKRFIYLLIILVSPTIIMYIFELSGLIDNPTICGIDLPYKEG